MGRDAVAGRPSLAVPAQGSRRAHLRDPPVERPGEAVAGQDPGRRVRRRRSGTGGARQLFARTMRELALDDRPHAYLHALPGSALAISNVISMFGLNRRWRGALVGHLAVVEMTSVVPMGRYSRALERMGASVHARRFFDVHVLADAEHELLARRPRRRLRGVRTGACSGRRVRGGMRDRGRAAVREPAAGGLAQGCVTSRRHLANAPVGAPKWLRTGVSSSRRAGGAHASTGLRAASDSVRAHCSTAHLLVSRRWASS